MLVFYLFFVFCALIKSINSYSPKQKEKVHACLLLFKQRKMQDPKTFQLFLEKINKVLENAEQKMSMYAIATCYSRITDEQSLKLVTDFSNRVFVNAFTPEYLKLLSLETFGEEEYDDFSQKMQEFMLVYDEVFKEISMPKKGNKWYESNIFIIGIGITLVNFIIIIIICFNKKEKISNNTKDEIR